MTLQSQTEVIPQPSVGEKPLVDETTIQRRSRASWKVSIQLGSVTAEIELWNGIDDSTSKYYENTKPLCQKCLLDNKKTALLYEQSYKCPVCSSTYENARTLPRGIVDKQGQVMEVLKQEPAEKAVEKTEITFIRSPAFKYLTQAYFITSPTAILHDLTRTLALCYNYNDNFSCKLTGQPCSFQEPAGQLTCRQFCSRAIVIRNAVFRTGGQPRNICLLLDNDGELIGKELIAENQLRLPPTDKARAKVTLPEIQKLTPQDTMLMKFMNMAGKKEDKILSSVKTKLDGLQAFMSQPQATSTTREDMIKVAEQKVAEASKLTDVDKAKLTLVVPPAPPIIKEPKKTTKKEKSN